jgi:hypothetical protein
MVHEEVDVVLTSCPARYKQLGDATLHKQNSCLALELNMGLLIPLQASPLLPPLLQSTAALGSTVPDSLLHAGREPVRHAQHQWLLTSCLGAEHIDSARHTS